VAIGVSDTDTALRKTIWKDIRSILYHQTGRQGNRVGLSVSYGSSKSRRGYRVEAMSVSGDVHADFAGVRWFRWGSLRFDPPYPFGSNHEVLWIEFTLMTFLPFRLIRFLPNHTILRKSKPKIFEIRIENFSRLST
jgi:hypothetical protein